VVSRITTVVRDAAARPGVIPSYSSMAQDVIAGRVTEVETVLGDVVRRAARQGIAVPTLSAAYKTITGIDALLPSQNTTGQHGA
jgi:ketopantoate reductase